MCGIIGFHAKPKSWESWKQRGEWLNAMMTVCSLRGEDSAGVGVVRQDGEALAAKAAVHPWYFINSPIMAPIDRELPTAQIVLGHCRAATQGAVNNANAHPFTVGDVMMVHNGTIHATDMNTPNGVGFITDSHKLAALLSEAAVGDAHTVFGETGGAWAVVWYDKRDGSLNFARNDQRPMYFGHTPDKKILTWASESWMLLAGQSRAGDRLKSLEINEVPKHTHLKYLLDDEELRAYTRPIKEFVDYLPAYHHHGWRGNGRHETTNYNAQASEVPEWARYGKKVDFVVSEFLPYTSSAITGQLIGQPIGKEGGVEVRVVAHGFPHTKWGPVKNVSMPVFTGVVSGSITQGTGADKYVSVTIKDAVYVCTYKKYLRKNPAAPAILEEPPTNVIALPHVPSKVPGPGKNMLTIKEFVSKTAGGCCWCTDDIYLSDADTMGWSATGEPVCPGCLGEMSRAGLI